MDEFSIIEKYFKPLAAGFSGSLNLSDDAAIFTAPSCCELVITKDVISQGVHFIGAEDPALIAGKALRVNLSDLAAMGATPICYFLALILPRDTTEEWIEKFAEGLRKTQEEFNISLAGGDTTAIYGSLSISITTIGSVPSGMALKRSGAKTGDDIYVSGTLGDAALGLLSCQSRLASAGEIYMDSGLLRHDNDFLINRYLTPEPRISLGMDLRGIANSAMDISDGLVQDLGHICTASKVGAIIYTHKIPLSGIGQLYSFEGGITQGRQGEVYALVHEPKPDAGEKLNQTSINAALSGGDDYELLFTANPDKKSVIEQLAKSLSLPLTCIGKITAGNDVQVLDENGSLVTLGKKGFSHF